MARYNYAFKDWKENMVKSVARDIAVSTKAAIEVCNFLRGRNLAQAKRLVEEVVAMKRAIPFKRFTNGVGHKPGIAAGRYPQILSKHMLKMFKEAESNAQIKGLGDNLLIVHLCAHKASSPMHQGRQRRRSMKRTHIELVVEELESEKKVKKAVKKETPKEIAEDKSSDVAQKKQPVVEKKEEQNVEEDSLYRSRPGKGRIFYHQKRWCGYVIQSASLNLS